MSALVDRFGRVHTDLRISLTDRCSLRCTYCMPAEGVPWLPGDTMLTTREITRIVAVAIGLGVTEVRLTGGEPLLRTDVVELVAGLTSLQTSEGRLRTSMTTNGLRLPSLAGSLRDAGLERINISLDTLRRTRYLELTRRDRLIDALAGIEAARAAGFSPVKLNAVLMRGVNDDEVGDLLAFAVERGLHLRFIEHMPLDAGHTWRREAVVTRDEILAAARERVSLAPVDARGSSPAEEFHIDGTSSTLGVIASVTKPFCGSCDRVRLTADGQFRNCLFATEEADLRSLIRGGASDDEIASALIACVARKAPGHAINSPTFVQPRRPMSAIGG